MIAVNILGWIAAAALVMAAIFALVAFGFDTLHRWHQRIVDRAVTAELRRKGVDMYRLASWFHNVDHAATWMAIAENMSRGIWPDVRTVRDAGIPSERANLQLQRQAPRKEATHA